MVVDGDRRIVRAAVEAAVDDGMPLRLVQLRLRSEGLEERDGVLGGAAHIGLAPRFDRNRRDLDDLLEDAFELRALAARVRLQLFSGESGHPGRSSSTSFSWAAVSSRRRAFSPPSSSERGGGLGFRGGLRLGGGRGRLSFSGGGRAGSRAGGPGRLLGGRGGLLLLAGPFRGFALHLGELSGELVLREDRGLREPLRDGLLPVGGHAEKEEGRVLGLLGLGEVVRRLEGVRGRLGEVEGDRVGLFALGELEEARPTGLGDDDVRAALLEPVQAAVPVVVVEMQVNNAHSNGGL